MPHKTIVILLSIIGIIALIVGIFVFLALQQNVCPAGYKQVGDHCVTQ